MNLLAAAARLLRRHGRRQTIQLRWQEPPHPGREADPDYRLFERRRRALRRNPAQWRCTVPGCRRGDLELHHIVPYALQTGVDLAALNERDGLSVTPATFAAWLHGPRNTRLLCAEHHDLVHSVPAAAWEALTVWRADLPPPVVVLRGKERQR